MCRFVLGATFVFSGFVKAVDPLGFFYKIQDYLAAFGMPWVPQILSLLTAIGLSAIEFCVGIFLLVGIRRRLAVLLALLMMLVMTPLTLYLALFNPVADCGCFGDAWVLTNWQTFGKNIVLLAMAVVVYRWKADILRFVTPKLAWMVSMYTFLFIFVLAFYCLANLPILDFRPYKIGVNLKQAMEIPEGAKLSVLETYFILEKDGQRQEVTWDNYPDSTWTLVGTRTVELEPGYEPPIKDFNITSLETGEDLTDRILSDTGYVFLLVMPRVENADDSHIDLINEIYDYSVENGYAFYALTSSPAEAVEFWSDRTGGEYPFGVVGVVLFVQLYPKLVGCNVESEVRQLHANLYGSNIGNAGEGASDSGKYKAIDPFGMFALSLALTIGILIGQIEIPLPGGMSFSFGTSGGPLFAGLIIGHFGHVGKFSISSPSGTLKVMREFGLCLFLLGAGTDAGSGFVEVLMEQGAKLFLLGAVITLVPMIAACLIAKLLLKLDTLTTLGSVCGGMTSTPALGALISLCKTEDVAASYAATYPFALILVVIGSQVMALLW